MITFYVSEALLLDLDGVVTDPSEKRITNEILLDQFVQSLLQGNIVGFNTGRSLTWMERQVLQPLEQKLQEKGLPRKYLQNIIAIGEKGGAEITYSEAGEKQIFIDPHIQIPEDLQEQIYQLFKKGYTHSKAGVHTNFSTMFIDDEKQTMVSIEMKDGESYDENSLFKHQQQILIKALEEILADNKSGTAFKIDPTTICTDVENKTVGKAYGTQRFLTILQERSIFVKNFLAFGDSESDIEMSEELERQNQHVTFVYVGKDNPWKDQSLSFQIDATYQGQYQNGTAQYLTSR